MNTYQSALFDAARFVRENERFLLISHVNPDGDTTGSTLAMALLLEQMNKSYVIVNQGPTPEVFSFLPRYDKIVDLSSESINETFTHVIALDAADSSRMGDVTHLFAPDVALLNIDHHPTNDAFGTCNVIVPSAAATAEIMYDWCEAASFSLNKEIATCIYTGLLTDTGGFRYSNTTPHVMEAASKLLTYGINSAEIAERCLESITLEHVQVLRRALQSLEVTHGNLVATMQVTNQDFMETMATNEDVSGIVNYGRNIEGVEVGLFFTEIEQGVIKVSFRSRATVDVALVAKELGGGGHARAAGCTLKGLSLQEAKDKVWWLVTKALGVESHE
ncbi:DHH family phosphoesterase [Brevibacillus daliensis]|uniref:DHH family phosphoesterase n=1 Tax=Brevibacillus daliensis TaxID=2892995 RepID=UPI001E39BCFC|nr:bifunctional oligoribonuclease/PAP phosphatase NrnA [Brevibacillus daliensis]